MFKDMFSNKDKNEKVNTIENLDAETFETMIKEDENCAD